MSSSNSVPNSSRRALREGSSRSPLRLPAPPSSEVRSPHVEVSSSAITLVPGFSDAPAAEDPSSEKFILRLKRPQPAAVAVSQENSNLAENFGSSTTMPAEERASSAPPQRRTRNPVPMVLPVRQAKKANGGQDRDFIVHDLVPPMSIPAAKPSPYPTGLLADDDYAEFRNQRSGPTPFMEPLPSHYDGSTKNPLSAAEVQFFDHLQRLVNETSENLPKNPMDSPPGSSQSSSTSAIPLPSGVPAAEFPCAQDGSLIIPSYDMMIFPAYGHPRGRNFYRAPISTLRVGHLAVIFNGVDPTIATLDDITTPKVVYVVSSRSGDGTVDLIRVFPEQSSGAGSLRDYPHWVYLSAEISDFTCIVYSRAILRAGMLPKSLLSAISDLNIIPSTPEDHPLPTPAFVTPSSSSAPASVSPTQLSVLYPGEAAKLEEREANMRFTRRCMMNDTARHMAFISGSKDFSGDSFWASVHNSVDDSSLLSLPVFHPLILEQVCRGLFVQRCVAHKGKFMGVTISMFLDWKTVGKQLTELGACYSLVKALRHFGLCFNKLFCASTPTVFNPDPNFFLTIVSTMSNQLLVGGGSPDSLEGVAMNFLVWTTDKKFAQFAKAASLKENQSLSFDDFKALCMSILDYSPRALKDEYRNMTSGAIPPQVTSADPPVDKVLPTASKQKFSTFQNSNVSNFGQAKKARVSQGGASLLPALTASPPVFSSGQLAAPTSRPNSNVCIADFCHKIDGVQFPACSKSPCDHRHIALPAPGRFASADKTRMLATVQKMRGSRTFAYAAAIRALV